MAVYTAINDAGSFFNTVLYTGNGVTDTAITGVGFAPNFVWFKQRSATVFHNVYDTVRGVQEVLVPNGDDVQYNDDETLLAFDADGFTIGLRSNVNLDTATYVAWNWKAGTTTGIAGSPDITPDGYSFNATSGFSIIEYTGSGTAGDTFPHGLGVVPNMIIVKRQDSPVTDWRVYHGVLGATKYILLNTAAVVGTATSQWNDTAPTSTLVSLGNSSGVNSVSVPYIAYCFANVPGYSKFGGYTGNDAAEGAFVYTGFRPAYVMIKSSNYAVSWTIFDNRREGFNPENDQLLADTIGAETATTNMWIDLLSNGFKCRGDNSNTNGAYDYIYAAFAEAPLVNAEGVPVNAR
jgi:hypothetical protein